MIRFLRFLIVVLIFVVVENATLVRADDTSTPTPQPIPFDCALAGCGHQLISDNGSVSTPLPAPSICKCRNSLNLTTTITTAAITEQSTPIPLTSDPNDGAFKRDMDSLASIGFKFLSFSLLLFSFILGVTFIYKHRRYGQ